ncbi:hypothetical protein EVAR_88978_1 [Eumeta japonica]|uniref:Uncharacterized protein n=1 Tax=Eumeta variegata TaxID=151549 RepID=A0A4C1VRC2_EUMVA|nr:hypothetical protein EVAR_88978_1 [Eumeta japonica]
MRTGEVDAVPAAVRVLRENTSASWRRGRRHSSAAERWPVGGHVLHRTTYRVRYCWWVDGCETCVLYIEWNTVATSGRHGFNNIELCIIHRYLEFQVLFHELGNNDVLNLKNFIKSNDDQ